MKSCALMSLFLFCAFLALIGAAVVLYQVNPTVQAQRQAELLYRQQRDAQDLADRAANAARWAAVWTAWEMPVKVAGGVLIILTPPGLAALALQLRREAIHRRTLVKADARGLLPVSLARLQAGEYDHHAALALAGYHATQAERARHPAPPALPANLRSYAPRYGNDAAPRLPGERPAAAPPVIGPRVPVPSLGELLQRRQLGQGGRLLLGYTPDAGGAMVPVEGGLEDVFAVGVGGLPGSGKTTTAAFLAGQAVALGSRLLVLDPHRDAPDSLAQALAPLRGAYILPPAAAEDEILQALQVAHDELQRRKAGQPGAPWVIVADEWTALVRRGRIADQLIRLVEETAQESRKLQVRLILAAQIWTAEASGGSALRDALGSAYLHRCKPGQGRLLIPTAGREVATLDRGQALLWRPSGEVLPVTIPRTGREDLEHVARLLPPPSPSPSSVDGLGRSRTVSDGAEPENRPETGDLDRPTATDRDRPPLKVLRPVALVDKARDAGMELSAQEWADLGRMDAGETPQAIASKDTGQTDGRPYRRRRDELQRLADLVRGWPEGEPWARADAQGEEG